MTSGSWFLPWCPGLGTFGTLLLFPVSQNKPLQAADQNFHLFFQVLNVLNFGHGDAGNDFIWIPNSEVKGWSCRCWCLVTQDFGGLSHVFLWDCIRCGHRWKPPLCLGCRYHFHIQGLYVCLSSNTSHRQPRCIVRLWKLGVQLDTSWWRKTTWRRKGEMQRETAHLSWKGLRIAFTVSGSCEKGRSAPPHLLRCPRNTGLLALRAFICCSLRKESYGKCQGSPTFCWQRSQHAGWQTGRVTVGHFQFSLAFL